FALAVDDRGSARFAELRHGHAVPLTTFRVDLDGGESEVLPRPAPRLTRPAAWTGDVEPVPFPFRFGVGNRQGEPPVDFDHAGEWILEVGPNGMLYLWRVDGAESEVLPRPALDGVLLSKVDAIRGVRGGFAVCGRAGERLAVAHYDLRSGRCRAHVLRPAGA